MPLWRRYCVASVSRPSLSLRLRSHQTVPPRPELRSPRPRRASRPARVVLVHRGRDASGRARHGARSIYRSRARLSLDRDRLSAARRARTYTRTKRSTFLGGCDETRQTHTRTSHHAHHAGDEPRESGCAVIGGCSRARRAPVAVTSPRRSALPAPCASHGRTQPHPRPLAPP